MSGLARAADEDIFLEQLQPSTEQALGQGHSVLWTMPLVATQYQPLQPTPAMQAALQAQNEGRFLNALIQLDDLVKNKQVDGEALSETNLLRASFLLQGNQSQQALEILAPLLNDTRHAADAYALSAMAHLEQGQMREALEAAQRAHDSGGDALLPHLVLSYALQGAGRLKEARDLIRGFNGKAPQSALALAREAELALTLDRVAAAQTLVNRAREMDAEQPYIVAVNGLTYLITGQAQAAKAAFQTALKRNPKDAKALLGLGLAEIKLGNFQAGQEKLQAANEAEPNNALILTYLGRSQQQAGQSGAARESWRSAQEADPKDPTPWLYQAQAELQANRPLDARASLREAQARTAYRSVYRGQNLLREDEQLLQANLAEIQRRLGLDNIALHTLSDTVGESSATNLRNQADLLQGQRFGESARRSLLLQSLFNDRPGNLPSSLDIYGDGAGQTGAGTPQRGAVSGLSSQQASYNNYDELFNRRTMLEANATAGSRNTGGAQVRLGVGSDTLGLSLAGLQFKSDGFAAFDSLDNHVAQGVVQWRPSQSTQAFVTQQTFKSLSGATFFPADPLGLGEYAMIQNNSRVTRLGLRHSLTDNSELRGLWSFQQTDQVVDGAWIFPPSPFPQFSQYGSSNAHSAELQYRRTGSTYTTQWGVQQSHGKLLTPSAATDMTLDARQFYAAWQQALNPSWQLEAGLGWGSIKEQDNISPGNSTYLTQWLPKLGVVFMPDAGTHVRLAARQGMDAHGAGDATLAPVTLAGVLLTRTSDISQQGKLVKAVTLGADKQLGPDWLLDAQTQRRKTDDPGVSLFVPTLLRQQVDESRLAVHWQPQNKTWVVSLAYDAERILNPATKAALDSVYEQSLRSQQVAVRWFASSRWTVNGTWSHNRVGVAQQSFFNTLLLTPPEDRFNQLDADLNWRFNGERGSLTAGVRNATDRHFLYTDIDPLNPRFSNGRMLYASIKNTW